MYFDMPDCGGCRTCELACSFKHLGKFNADVSSIQVMEKQNGLCFEIRLVGKGEDEVRFPCDLCQDRNAPFCLDYCHEKEKLQEILIRFKEKANL